MVPFHTLWSKLWRQHHIFPSRPQTAQKPYVLNKSCQLPSAYSRTHRFFAYQCRLTCFINMNSRASMDTGSRSIPTSTYLISSISTYLLSSISTHLLPSTHVVPLHLTIRLFPRPYCFSSIEIFPLASVHSPLAPGAIVKLTISVASIAIVSLVSIGRITCFRRHHLTSNDITLAPKYIISLASIYYQHRFTCSSRPVTC